MRTCCSFLFAAFVVPLVSSGAELRPETLQVWKKYVRSADSRMTERLGGARSFLWTDEAAGQGERLRRGEILVAPVNKNGIHRVPGGLIHDWWGAAFIPGATLDTVTRIVHDYRHYKEFCRPIVADCKLLASSPDEQRFSMLWLHRVMKLTIALEGHYRSHDYPVDCRRRYGISDTTEVPEIKSYGEPDEHSLPAGSGTGFIWKLHSIARYEERDGGVYVEVQAIALSRGVPASLGWLVNPMVSRFSRNSLVVALRQTREAVAGASAPDESAASSAAHPHGGG